MCNIELIRQLLYYSPLLIKQFLYFAPLFLQLIIIWRMAVSGSRRSFPIFFGYMVFQSGNIVVGQLLLHFAPVEQYLYFYGAQAMVGAALSFAVIYEVFSTVFRPYDALRDFSAVMFRWAGLVLLIVALVQALSTPGNESNRILAAVLVMERSISVIACGLLLFLLLFSKNLGLNWKQQVFGLALGFGLAYGIELALFTMRLMFGRNFADTLNLWHIIVWNASLGLWACYMFAPDRARKTAQAFAPKLILERWNQVLQSVNRPAPQGAFMPNLEKIVDDVLAHQAGSGTVH
jgi:hypothetical protein